MNANELARPFCWQYKSLPFRGLLFEPQLRPGSKDRLRCGLMLLDFCVSRRRPRNSAITVSSGKESPGIETCQMFSHSEAKEGRFYC